MPPCDLCKEQAQKQRYTELHKYLKPEGKQRKIRGVPTGGLKSKIMFVQNVVLNLCIRTINPITAGFSFQRQERKGDGKERGTLCCEFNYVVRIYFSLYSSSYLILK